MIFRHYIFIIISLISFGSVFGQDTQPKKTYSIDFSGINKSPKPNDDPKPESLQKNDFPNGIGFLKQEANLSANAIGAFDIKSLVDLDNFGKDNKDKLQFGKPSTTKTYLDAGYEPYPLKTDSVDFFYGDIDLNSFDTDSDHIYIITRDSRAVDNDEIRVLLNDKVIFNRITLSGQFVSYRVALNEGFNKIEVLAISSGSSEPVTCHLIIVDGLEHKLLDKNFNVAVGFKAKVVVVKEN